MWNGLLVEHRCVGVPVFFYDRNDEHDEFGPKVQVLDAWTLLLQRNLLFALEQKQHLILAFVLNYPSLH